MFLSQAEVTTTADLFTTHTEYVTQDTAAPIMLHQDATEDSFLHILGTIQVTGITHPQQFDVTATTTITLPLDTTSTAKDTGITTTTKI